MKLFTCASCEQLLFFENTLCQRCGHRLAFLPEVQLVSALEVAPDQSAAPVDGRTEFVALAPEAAGVRYRLCANYVEYDVCNWAVPADSPDAFCRSCALDDVIPNLEAPAARQAWVRLETAKRRLLYSLLDLGLPVERRPPDGPGLAFSFKSSSPEEHVFTGHSDGLITINIAEADDPFREKARQQMGETYRTLLGHFRHEVGHYYWDRLIKETHWLAKFRARFGAETSDYASAQQRHYGNGAPSDWMLHFVSAYASMHPWEDWAETFAHYLHMVDTLDTAGAYGLVLKPKAASGVPLPNVSARRVHFDDFDGLIEAWFPLTNALNSLNRSMGLLDLYPFVLSGAAIDKLRFVHQLIEETAAGTRRGPGPEPASGTVADTGPNLGSSGTMSEPRPSDQPSIPPPLPPSDPPRQRDDDEAPETPPTEPQPVPVEDPPDAPGRQRPYVVE